MSGLSASSIMHRATVAARGTAAAILSRALKRTRYCHFGLGADNSFSYTRNLVFRSRLCLNFNVQFGKKVTLICRAVELAIARCPATWVWPATLQSLVFSKVH